MAACCGEYHTITLSNDGTLHSFGCNHNGQLGLGHYKDVSVPTPIPNLPQINFVFKNICDFLWNVFHSLCGL